MATAVNSLNLPALPSGYVWLGNGTPIPTASLLPATALPLTVVTGTTQAMAANNAYQADNAALVTLTLPTTAALGSEIEVLGLGAGGWAIAQNAGQSIISGPYTTTAGVTGSVTSQLPSDCIQIKCTVANTTFQVVAGGITGTVLFN